MLALVEVYDWDTKHPGNRMNESYANAFLLNTNRMINIIDRTIDGNSGSQLLFSNNPNDPRDSPDRLFVNLSASELRNYRDVDEFSKFAVLDVFPSLDVTNLGTPVETLIEWDNIAYVYMTYNDYTHDRCHVVYYDESWKRKVVIVNHTLLGVLLIALLGNDLD
jgi:hypothetical protein